MEAETTEKSEESIASILNVCASCKESFHNKEAKLLPCLHTVCSGCVTNTLTVGETQAAENQGCQVVKCPVCSQEAADNTLIDNLFVSTTPAVPSTSKDDGETGDTKICTGCEENTAATSYCTECEEYLCDDCVQAHRRVRITKDHTIQPKDSITPASSAEHSSHKTMHCPVHKQELLKLYCETCEKLTCRDCQLLEHKDHKYQFVDEAALKYKEHLCSLLDKIREKKAYVEGAKALIDKRSSEITEKEQKVASDIRSFIMKVATELNKRGKQLMTDLQTICKAKKGQLEKKNTEVCELSAMLNHTLKFAEFCLEKDHNGALLYTKKAVNSRLRGILKTKCEVPNPYHVLDLKFGYDAKTQLVQIPQLGGIFVEGIPFNQPNFPAQPSSNTTPANVSPGSSSNTLRQLSPGPSSGGNPPSQSANLGKGMPHEELTRDMSPQQKAAFLMKLKKMQEHRQMVQQQQQLQQQQQQQQHQYMQQQQQQQQQAFKHLQQATSPSSSTGTLHSQLQQHPQYNNMAQSRPQQRLSHLPPQSSFISSSNSHNQRNQQQSYYPPPLKGPHPLQLQQQQQQNASARHAAEQEALIKINLSQLQERRVAAGHHPNHANPYQQQQQRGLSPGGAQFPGGNMNMQNPIVIQPTSDFSPERLPDSAMMPSRQQSTNQSSSLSDCMHNSNSNNRPFTDVQPRNIKPEETHRPSCSFASSAAPIRPKMEPRTPQSDTDINPIFPAANSSGSRTPTPRAESTTNNTQQQQQPVDILPDLDSLANIGPGTSAGSSMSDAISSILGSDLDSATASEQVLERILGLKPTPTPTTPKDKMLRGKTASLMRSQLSRTLSGGASRAEDDPSEDWCAVCNNGGDLLCCDGCPKVFHLTCHVPDLPTAPSDDWFCTLCIKDEDIKMTAPEEKTAENQGKLSDKERKVPNYYKIISHPMDLKTVKTKLAEGTYTTLEQCLKDLQLIFANCAMYNLVDSAVGRAGRSLEAYYHQQVARYAPYVAVTTLAPPADEGDSEVMLEDSQKTDDTPPSSQVTPPPRKKRKSCEEEDDDEDWVAEDGDTQNSEESSQPTPHRLSLKKRLKRKRDSNTSEESAMSTEEPIMHVR